MESEPAPEARIVAIGEPVEGAEPLHMGTLEAMLEIAWAHDAAWRAEIVIWTEDRIYGAADIEKLRPPHGSA